MHERWGEAGLFFCARGGLVLPTGRRQDTALDETHAKSV